MADPRDSKGIAFGGTRRELAGILLRDYLLLVPMIGLYRFWLTSHRRRFYWSHTRIRGDALEYTGNASQLLLGFLMTLAIFVPAYGLLFFLSTQSSETAIVGYGLIGAMAWFLAGYAAYRSRDFLLSRTLWRGIRFDQAGSAWSYALRRFLWSILVIVTAGLAYPFMAVNLWRYRYQHSWFGNQQFSFKGSWKQIAGPFYLSYLLVAIIAGLGLLVGAGMGALPGEGETFEPSGLIPWTVAAVLCGIIVLFYQSRELSRMLSAVQIGAMQISVTVRARSLIWAYLLFGLALAAVLSMLLVGGLVVLSGLAGDAFAGGTFNVEIFIDHLKSSFVTVVAVVLGYLLILSAFTLARELFIRLAFWKLVSQGTRVSGLESLNTVKARGEDKSLVGEGLADALNVGAY